MSKLGTTKGLKKKEKKTVLHKKLRTIFNRYVRLRDCDNGRMVNCISCGKSITVYEAQAGHLYPDVTIFNNLRLNERNVNAQCSHCNMFLEGNTNEYRQNLKMKIGRKALNWLDEHARDFVIRDVEWYHKQIDYYTKALEELEQLRGIK